MDLTQTQQYFDDRDGDRERLLTHIRPRLVLWAASRMSAGLRSKMEPEDVAQDTLFAVVKAWDTFEGKDVRSFMAWLFQIAENRIRDHVDHFGAKKRQQPPIVPFSLSQTSPSAAAARSERVRQLMQGVELLRPEYREVFRLRRLEERSTKEIAELMGRSPNAVRVLYCRALKELRKAMNGDGQSE